jgi:uncharacterized protein YegL
MYGEPIEAVKTGLKSLHSALRKDPQTLETAFISVITFGPTAKQLISLTEVAAFKPPEVSASGGTPLGEALNLVCDCADREVNKGTAEEKGDWKPLVFILTDGVPTDNIDAGLNKFKAAKWGLVLACAAGANVDNSVLRRVAGENVIALENCDSNSLSAFFNFVSKSITVSSKKIDSGQDIDSMSQLPPLPEEISLIKI